MDDEEDMWRHRYSYLNGAVQVAIREDLDAGLGGTLFDVRCCEWRELTLRIFKGLRCPLACV